MEKTCIQENKSEERAHRGEGARIKSKESETDQKSKLMTIAEIKELALANNYKIEKTIGQGSYGTIF